jgi:hypothetical protein
MRLGRAVDRVVDAGFRVLLHPHVRRWRRYAFVVTIPAAYLIFRLRGLETGLAVLLIEFLIGLTVMAIVLVRADAERREALLDLLAHPLARRLTHTEIEVLATIPLALASPLRRRRGRPFGYAGRSNELAFALALAPAVLAEAVVVHLLIPPSWLAVELVILAISLYGYLWLVSLAVGMRSRPHRLTDEALEVRFGPLYRATVPLAVIAAAEARPAQRRGRMGLVVEGDEALLLIEGRADVALDLAEPVPVHRPIADPVRTCRLTIAVDRPAEFLDALTRARSSHTDAPLRAVQKESPWQLQPST